MINKKLLVMCKCKICGEETRKGRQTCIGCRSTLEVAKKYEKAPQSKKDRAAKHLIKKPGLIKISWHKFF